MTTTIPAVNPAGRYSVVETTRALGISRPTLRSYTNSGLIRYGIRKSNGRKFYSGNEIIRFWKATL